MKRIILTALACVAVLSACVEKEGPIETPVENLKYHYIYEITDALEPMIFENWIFVTDDCAIEVSYLYRRDEDPKIIDKNREIAKRTVNTLKIK